MPSYGDDQFVPLLQNDILCPSGAKSTDRPFVRAERYAVQPADAEIFIDGERWTMSTEQPRLLVRLTEGQHIVEVKKPGFQTYSELIGISRERTLSLNVSLSR